MKTSITSRQTDRAADLIRERVRKMADVSSEEFQLFLERGGEFQDDAEASIRRLMQRTVHTDERVSSAWAYPPEYEYVPVEKQIAALAEIFGLDASRAIVIAKTLPKLPEGTEGYFAWPKVQALANRHFKSVTNPAEQDCMAAQLVLDKIAASRPFYSWRRGQIRPEQFRVHPRTAHAIKLLGDRQDGDFIIAAGQLGLLYRGCSVNLARDLFVGSERPPEAMIPGDEFGFETVAGGSVALTSNRFVRWDQLHVDLPGNEFSDDGDGVFAHAPYLLFDGDVDLVKFDTVDVSLPYGLYGSASGRLPQ